jgi:hypothetical protein
MKHNIITATLIADSAKADHVNQRFGVRWLWIESFVFDTAGSLSTEYDGGSWQFYSLSNGGFYMSPVSQDRYEVACANGFDGSLSADALGVTCCLYAFSHLSFSPDAAFADLCTTHYHQLRTFALEHAEVEAILRAID